MEGMFADALVFADFDNRLSAFSAARKNRIFSSVVHLLRFMVWILSIEPD